tara:strand:+ start:92 stop:304 length:213 start_codon:yes stop_codon:yes gene_type:complete
LVAATSAIKLNDEDATIKKGQFSEEMKVMADEVYTDQEAHNSNIEYASRDELSSFTSFGQSKSDEDFKKK